MTDLPRFPRFRALEVADRDHIRRRLWHFQPETSELTFTNLFIWRVHYGLTWSLDGDWLLFAGQTGEGGPFAFPPVGPSPRAGAAQRLAEWLKGEAGAAAAVIERADAGLVAEVSGLPGMSMTPLPEHFDYVYRIQDLVDLSGRKYHDKRNHLNSFRRTQPFIYEPLAERHLPDCLRLADNWCHFKRCEEDLSLMGEWEAVREALRHFRELGLIGGAIRINGRVEAFTLGEMLNQNTAVVHIEKANPEIRGLYPAINQQFCEHAWAGATFINREQDLGEPGLRAAKQSYHPHHLVEKFRLSFP